MTANNIFESRKLYNNVNNKLLEFYNFENKILDIGCGTGLIDREIKKINKKSYIVGVDISEEAIKIAKKYIDETYLLNLDNDKLPDFKNKFDIIILGDILEHLKRPDIFLSDLREYLNINGKILLSVPNIANWYIRLELLFGNFNYYDSGILDKAHLRFFTYPSVCELISNANFKISSFNFIRIQPNLSLIKKVCYKILFYNLLKCFLKIFKKGFKTFELDAVQLVFKIIKNE